MEENPVQLRLGFSSPRSPVSIKLSLSGLRVVVWCIGGESDLVGSYFGAIGVTVDVNNDGVMTFAIQDLRRVLAMPPQVSILVRGELEPLWTLVREPSPDDSSIKVSFEGQTHFNLSWHNGHVTLNETLAITAAPAFLAMEIPFTADSLTWDELMAASRLPVLLGRARVNLDGFVEIVTSQPQRLETTPLRALFRLNETHYGVPLAYSSDVSAAPGIIWEGRRPTYDRAPDSLPQLPFELSDHARNDLRGLVDRLAERRAEAIVWGSGLGRRVFALAAVEALDAFPLLIVTFPHALWSWQRHLDLLGRTYSLTHDRADVHLVTYRDLLSRPLLRSPASAIFDDLNNVGVEHLSALHSLDGLLDMHRIACATEFPEDASHAIELMSVLKPAEFRPGLPLQSRYPFRTEERALEHVESYLSRRDLTVAGGHDFRRSTVELLQPTDEQLRGIDAAIDENRDLSESLAEALVLVSAGVSGSVSPKVTRATEIAAQCNLAGERVALVTRHLRTAQLLRTALREFEPVSVDGPASEKDVSSTLLIVRTDGQLGDLRSFDQVVILDYPWSSLALEPAIGAAGDQTGTNRVTCLHLDCPLDVRSSLLAARRREMGAVKDPFSPLTEEEIAYLLSQRR